MRRTDSRVGDLAVQFVAPLAEVLDEGAPVIGGTVNQSGGLIVRADRIGRDTMLARIVDMVARAQRSPSFRFAT